MFPGDQKVKNRCDECRSGISTKGERDSLSLWCRKVQRSHSTFCFVHETRPGSHMLRVWLPSAQPLGLEKRAAQGHSRAVLLQVAGTAEKAGASPASGQAVAGSQDALRCGAGSCDHARCDHDVQEPQWRLGLRGLHLPLPPPGLRSAVGVFKRTHLRTGFLESSGNKSPSF